MTTIEKGSNNVFADLGFENADEMLVKAQLARQISAIFQDRGWTQAHASEVLGISQPKLSGILRGQLRGISEAKMLECLTRLGRDVQIIIGDDSHPDTPGRVSVVAA